MLKIIKLLVFSLLALLIVSSCKSGKDKIAESDNEIKKIYATEFGKEISGLEKNYAIREFDIPESISLCGEVIDLTDQNNLEKFDREFTISVWDRAQVFMWVKRTSRFFPYFEKRLKEAGLPDDLKYLAVAESSLHTHIKSKAGALGIWQFMKDTARRYGLKVKRGNVDERLCYERSTDAALEYLKDLREKFDTWTLAMAAYNCGEYKLNEAVKNQEEGYLGLHLPRETERYVFRIAAIKYLLENLADFGYEIKPVRMYKPIANDYLDIDIRKRIYISDLVKQAGVTYKEFVKLNPQMLSSLLPKGKYTLKVPVGQVEKFTLALSALEKKSESQLHAAGRKTYIVKPGDALYNISWETGVSVSRIKKLNRLRGSRIYPGQKLILK